MISSASTISNKSNLSEYSSTAAEGAATNNEESGILDFLNLLQLSSEGTLPGVDANALKALSGLDKDLLSKMDMKQLQALLANANKAEAAPKLNEKENAKLLELLAANNKTAVKQDPTLKAQIKNGMAKPESLSGLDFQMNRTLMQPKAGLKEYMKGQDSKIIKSDGLNSQAEANNEISGKLLNEFNFGNSKASSTVDGAAKGDKNVIESLATQITQRINDINSVRPMQFNSETTIDINHAELGSMTVNIKKLNKELNIQITTGHADAKNVMMENRDALLSQLNSKGISVANLSIDSVFSVAGADDAKASQSQKFDSAGQQHSSADQQQQAKNSNQQQSDREKRNELWDILKDQREVMYA